MNKVYKLSIAAIAASLVLVNCSSVEDLVGGDDDNTVNTPFTGQFVDTYVKGLNYKCIGYIDGVPDQVTDTGTTNEKGEFTCSNKGELVEFSLGGYVVGSYQNSGFDEDAAPIVSPYDLRLGTSEAITNLAQLLQTLDNHTIDGVLTIPEGYTGLNDVSVKLDDPDFDALMADALNVTSLVDPVVAQAHLDETLASLAPAPAPADTAALEAFVSGNNISFDAGPQSMIATFAVGGYYEENADYFCNGSWSTTSETTIQVTCGSAEITTFEFIGELQNGMTVIHSEMGSVTITNIAPAVNPDA